MAREPASYPRAGGPCHLEAAAVLGRYPTILPKVEEGRAWKAAAGPYLTLMIPIANMTTMARTVAPKSPNTYHPTKKPTMAPSPRRDHCTVIFTRLTSARKRGKLQ